MAAENEDQCAAYVETLSAALGQADRRGPFRDYCFGLLMPVERKSVEPLALLWHIRFMDARWSSRSQGGQRIMGLVMRSTMARRTAGKVG